MRLRHGASNFPDQSDSIALSESIFQQLIRIRDERGAGFIVLVDPDKLDRDRLPEFAATCREASVDALFVGGSLFTRYVEFETMIDELRRHSALPVIGFPGSVSQISERLDAVLYLSIVSSRNPEYLFGQHIHAAPLIRRLGVEPIPTGYMLIESGRITTAQYVSSSMPLPRSKPDVAVATAMAAEMMGMKMLFTDGGSGAEEPVPLEMVESITNACTAPLIVGGGLRSAMDVALRVEAGASFIVVGNAFEERDDAGYVREMAAAAHTLVPRPV